MAMAGAIYNANRPGAPVGVRNAPSLIADITGRPLAFRVITEGANWRRPD